ncbi:fimbria/pilus outer membrane usher protein [Pseudomonas sp. SCB32]|uniref:fimbria/pilus outer membrane usher protein n=1 Tax=Pseudomonas sp. SCB32 TaxID=2653853 RepID=UPI0015B506B8|nr:fimbria/pilus outer membrane usher protein [Pseudomonas sp. SCB32]
MDIEQGTFSLQFKRSPLATAVASRGALPVVMGCGLMVGALLMAGGGLALADEPAGNDPSSSPQTFAAFNPSFFNNGGTSPSVDVSRFENGAPVEPGEYRLDVYVNDAWIGRMPIRAVSTGSGKDSTSRYCVKASQFGELGVDVTKLPPEKQQQITGDCVDFSAVVPDGKIDVDLSELTAHVSIPQLYVGRQVRGYVDPSQWDGGVTAGFLNYDTNLYRTDSNGSNSTQKYVGLNAGMNLAEWRLRYNGTYNHSKSDGSPAQSGYQSLSTYAQHDVTSLKSQFTAGQYYTPSDLFDSVPFTGVQLASDDRMLPDSQRGFAPDIRGVADTNARVRVKQGENVIYETTVAPGPFEINDLFNTGYAGDLTVEITEADGRVKSFLVPYASISQLVRPGVSRYSATAGQYHDDTLDREPNFAQGTYQYGLNNTVTAYTGGIVANSYQAAQGGLAFSTPLGALAADVTQSHATNLPTERYGIKPDMSGQSYRVTYSKMLEATSTNMTIAAYRFNSENFLSLQDYAQVWGRLSEKYDFDRQRNRYQLTLNQPVGERSSFYFSGSKQDYWNRSNQDTSFQAGYSTGFNWGTVNLSAARTSNGYTDGNGNSTSGDYQNTYMVSVNVPIGVDSGNPLSLTTNVNVSDDKNNTVQSTLSGTAGEERQVSYAIFGSRNKSDGDKTYNSGANLTYNSPHAIYNANVSGGDGYKQAGFGARGSIVAHPGGINFSQNQGETLAILEAKGAEGASINSNVGAKVAGNGYAVVGGLTPYRQNDIEIDPKGTSKDVELQVTSQSVAPRYGSIVMLKYPTTTGAPVLMTVKRDDGEVIPLGAEVLDAKGNSLSMVGQGGRIFLRGLASTGELQVKWGEGSGQRCQINYQLPTEEDKRASFLKTESTCRAVLDKPAIAQR